MSRLRSPYRCEQGAMRDHFAGVARQVEQQFEFLGREVNGFARNFDAVGGGINHKITGHNGRLGALRGAAQMGPHPRQQFLDAERLGDVVVGAGVERLNFGALVIAYRENEDGSRRRCADGAATSTPLRPGIIRSVMTRSGGQSAKMRRPSSGSLAVRTSKRLRRECSAQYASDLRFVVDNENSAGHLRSSSTGRLHHRAGRVSFRMRQACN